MGSSQPKMTGLWQIQERALSCVSMGSLRLAAASRAGAFPRAGRIRGRRLRHWLCAGGRETPGKVPSRPLLGSRLLFPGANVRGSLGTNSAASPSDGAATSRFGSDQLLLRQRTGKIPLATTRPHSSSCLPGPSRPSSPAEIPRHEAWRIFLLQLRTASLGTCGPPQPFRPGPSWAAQPEHHSPQGPGRWPRPGAALQGPGKPNGKQARLGDTAARAARQRQTPNPNLRLLFLAEGCWQGPFPCRSCRGGRSHYRPSLHTAQPGPTLSLLEFSPQRDLIS